MSRLKKVYKEKLRSDLKETLDLPNVNMIPKLSKVVVNCVTKDCVTNSKVVDSIVSDLSLITGQKAIVAKAKKSEAGFKLRKGQALGAYVTLRGNRMYEFLDRLINVSLPRVRDFRGVSSKGFDGKGNYNLGLKEQIMFPEINYDKIDKVRGLGVSIVTTAKNNEEGRELLRSLGMPFKKDK
jgi:large subunit ribosomal protein L5